MLLLRIATRDQDQPTDRPGEQEQPGKIYDIGQELDPKLLYQCFRYAIKL